MNSRSAARSSLSTKAIRTGPPPAAAARSPRSAPGWMTRYAAGKKRSIRSAVARNDAVRASSRPKNSSTNRRATCVERTRSVGAWKVPTFSAREWRSATLAALGANGSWTCTKSIAATSSASSIVRAMSIGGDGAVARRETSGSSSPTPSTRTPWGSHKTSGSSAALRISRRESRTSSGERDGASTSSRCPRAAICSESRATKPLTSWFSSSQG